MSCFCKHGTNTISPGYCLNGNAKKNNACDMSLSPQPISTCLNIKNENDCNNFTYTWYFDGAQHCKNACTWDESELKP